MFVREIVQGSVRVGQVVPVSEIVGNPSVDIAVNGDFNYCVVTAGSDADGDLFEVAILPIDGGRASIVPFTVQRPVGDGYWTVKSYRFFGGLHVYPVWTQRWVS